MPLLAIWKIKFDGQWIKSIKLLNENKKIDRAAKNREKILMEDVLEKRKNRIGDGKIECVPTAMLRTPAKRINWYDYR